MEIRRFGIGKRRRDGAAGSRGVEGASIHADPSGVIAELALSPNAMVAPHTNPNAAYLIVIEGGGWVQVGEERARVAAGEAVVWPPNVVHGVWTEITPMRAIVVEFAAATRSSGPALLLDGLGRAVEVAAEGEAAAEAEALKAEGALRPTPLAQPPGRESPDGEPW